MNTTKYMVVPIIINLLWTGVRCQHHEDLEVKLINRLNDFFHFDHNIFLLVSLTDRNRCISVKDINITPQTVYIFDQNSVNTNNGTQLVTLKSIVSKNTFVIVVGDALKLTQNEQLLHQMLTIRQLDAHVKFGLFLGRNATSLDFIEEVFRETWIFGIVNIF